LASLRNHLGLGGVHTAHARAANQCTMEPRDGIAPIAVIPPSLSGERPLPPHPLWSAAIKIEPW